VDPDRGELVLDSLTVSEPNGRPLVSDVSVRAESGRAIGIVGQSGAGKSLTGQVLGGILPKNLAVTGGSLVVGGERQEGHYTGRSGSVGYIFQQPRASLNPTIRVGDQLAIVLRRHGATRRSWREAAETLLTEVGFREPRRFMRFFPHELSGGMAQRVAIAMSLASRPKFLVADEPTTALDVTIQMQVAEHLRLTVDRDGVGLVLISHDLGLVSDLCDFVYVMYRGQVLEEGLVQEVMTSPRHPYTVAFLESSGLVAPRRRDGAGTIRPDSSGWSDGDACAYLSQCGLASEACLSRPALAETGEPGHRSRCIHAASVAV